MARCCPFDRPIGGFTLYELLLVMALGLILLTQAAPALQGVRERLQLQAHGQLLYSSLMLARSEAVRGNRPVWVCALNSKVNLEIQGCQPAGSATMVEWPEGVLVFADAPYQPNGRYDSGERLHHLLFAGKLVQLRANHSAIAFSAAGRLQTDSTPYFELRSAGGQCHHLQLLPTGRGQWCRQADCCG